MRTLGALFIGMFFMVLIMRPGVVTGDVPNRPVQQSEPVRTPDVTDLSKVVSMFEMLIDKMEHKDTPNPTPTLTIREQEEDRSNTRAITRQDAQEEMTRYNGNDPVVRQRLGLQPKVNTDRVTVQEFDRLYADTKSNTATRTLTRPGGYN
jgi:hypothetical protein